jgi:hypothetical protein
VLAEGPYVRSKNVSGVEEEQYFRIENEDTCFFRFESAGGEKDNIGFSIGGNREYQFFVLLGG